MRNGDPILVFEHHSPKKKKQGVLGEMVDSRIRAQREPNELGIFPHARKKENAQKIYNSL